MTRRWRSPAIFAGTLAGVLAVLAAGVAWMDESPGAVASSMFAGAFGSKVAVVETLLKCAIILLCALAAAIPAQAGVINIGAEGQLQLGALGAAIGASAWPGGSPAVGVVLMVACAMGLAGAWGAISGALRAALRVSEALTSLFLNYVALHLVQYLVHGPMKDPASLGWPMSPRLPDELLLSRMWGTRLHAGIFVAVGLCVLLAAGVYLTRRGLELRAVGHNPGTAAMVGIPVRTYLVGAFVAGASLAGLAGYYEVAGTEARLRPGLALGLGYTGFLVAWMSRGRIELLIPLSLIAAGVISGGEKVQVDLGLPEAGADVLLGCMLVLVLAAHVLWSRHARETAIERTLGGRHA